MRAVVAGPILAGLILARSVSAEPARNPASEPLRELYTRRTAWIWSEPGPEGQRLGFARGGTALPLRAEAPVRSRTCAGGYAPVSPRGWVCRDDDISVDPADRAYRVALLLAPRASGLPFDYAISNGVPLYRRLPTPSEWERAERDLGRAGTYKKYRWNEKHERLAEERVVAPHDEVPFFLRDGASARGEREPELVRTIAPLGTMLAYVKAFEHAGRTWLVSSDGTVFPSDRVRPYRRSSFHGLVLSGQAPLPVAWVRAPSATRYAGTAYSTLSPSWPRHAAIRLDAALMTPVTHGKRRLWRTLERTASGEPLFVDDSEVTIARAEPRPSRVGPDGKWIAVSIRGGTLVAYEGDRPVFTTLVSPGAGGVPREGIDLVKASTTPLGTYHVQYKYRSQTMSPQKDKPETERTFWIAEVPHAQYFQIPFALHTTYWHDDFGQLMSGGCVNLSPEDGRWMFEWTSPALPEGWDGVWAGGENGRGTVVVVNR